MKKLLLILSIAVIMLTSCCKEEPNLMTVNDIIGTYEFEHPELGTQTFTINPGGLTEWGATYPASITILDETVIFGDMENGESYIKLTRFTEIIFDAFAHNDYNWVHLEIRSSYFWGKEYLGFYDVYKIE